jgi:hypothetical protein
LADDGAAADAVRHINLHWKHTLNNMLVIIIGKMLTMANNDRIGIERRWINCVVRRAVVCPSTKEQQRYNQSWNEYFKKVFEYLSEYTVIADIQKLIRIYSNREYSNTLYSKISVRVFVFYEYIWIFEKSIRILIRIVNIRECSNTRILEYLNTRIPEYSNTRILFNKK